MRRSLLALLLCLPALVGGSLCAHTVGYLIASQDGAERAGLLAATGHSYLEHPVVLALTLLTVLAVGGLLALHFELRAPGGVSSRAVSARPFLLVAPFGYLIQEHLERFVTDGSLPVATLAQPEVLAGLALQLPFALIAWLVARAVLGSARAVAERVRLAGGVLALRSPLAFVVSIPAAPYVARPAALAGCSAGRAPPAAFRI